MILWDLDNTLLRTWLHTQAALEFLATTTGRSAAELYAIADKMETRYSFELLLEAVGFGGSLRDEQVRLYREVIGRVGNDCLFPGVASLVSRCSTAGHTQGLITRGVVGHQQDKFASVTDLHPYINKRHRHFVPSYGNKGEVIASHHGDNGAGLVVVDDNPSDLINIHAHAIDAYLIRIRWPERDLFGEHAGDRMLWSVARSIDQLEELLLRHR